MTRLLYGVLVTRTHSQDSKCPEALVGSGHFRVVSGDPRLTTDIMLVRAAPMYAQNRAVEDVGQTGNWQARGWGKDIGFIIRLSVLPRMC